MHFLHGYYDNNSIVVAMAARLNSYANRIMFRSRYGHTNPGTTTFKIAGRRNHDFYGDRPAFRAVQGDKSFSGAPNFPCDPKLIAGVTKAMQEGHNQYAPMTGLASLKQLIADKVASLYGSVYDPADEVLVTASASEGLYSAIGGLVHPGDEVIYFEPSFDSYAPIVRLAGRQTGGAQAELA